MSKALLRTTLLSAAIAVTTLAVAQDDPRVVRHELMEAVGDAAQPVGRMLRGDDPFDASVVAESLQVMVDASTRVGDLFPAGSESGEDTRAAPAIWEDRAGFDEAVAAFAAAAEAAATANPGSLEEAQPVLGPVFNSCRNCHETYRLEEE